MKPAIRLDSTTRKLEALLNDTGTDVKFTASWYDQTAQDVQPTRGSTTLIASNGTTPVTIVAAPPQNVTRCVDYICAYNGNGATRIATFQIDDGGTDYIQTAISLATTESAVWTPTSGWSVVT